jgi:hypothetical protein
MKRPVAVVLDTGLTVTVVRRFNTIKQAERWIDRLKSPRAIKRRDAGRYGIDAPEEMVNPPRKDA